LGVSPPSRPPSGLSQMMDTATNSNTELVGKDSVVATWSLKRSQDWREIRGILPSAGAGLECSPKSK
jgi:hypothetical protein